MPSLSAADTFNFTGRPGFPIQVSVNLQVSPDSDVFKILHVYETPFSELVISVEYGKSEQHVSTIVLTDPPIAVENKEMHVYDLVFQRDVLGFIQGGDFSQVFFCRDVPHDVLHVGFGCFSRC